MKLGLEDKRVLIMAASQGIGLAAALGFHKAGARVAICARNQTGLDAAAARMPGCLALCADVTAPDQVDAMITQVNTRFGGVDVLVNNAGGPRAGTFDVLADADWRGAVEQTLMSAVRATRHVLPHMRAQKWGRIVNISSYGVKQPVVDLTLSNSIRMAVLGWAKTLALQVAKDNVLVNTVCPGWTKTARVTSLLKATASETGRSAEVLADEIAAKVPLGRMGEAEEVANLVVFLGSEAASYMTGTAIQVDGGLVQGYT